MLTYKEVIQIELAFVRRETTYLEWQKATGVYGQGMLRRLYRQWGLPCNTDWLVWETFLLLLVEIYK